MLEDNDRTNPDLIWHFLLEGNKRFAAGCSVHPRQDPTHREELTASQNPLAAILGCADSRVPAELLFDCGLGDLFVVRNAGHLPSTEALASLEYAIQFLNTTLIIVMGHSSCGAVTASLSKTPPASLALDNALETIRRNQREIPDSVDSAGKIHTLAVARQLPGRSSLLERAIIEDRLKIHACFYDLATGTVSELA